MKAFFSTCLSIFLCGLLFAQSIPDLSEKEAELKLLTDQMIDDSLLAETDPLLKAVYGDTSIPILYQDSLFAAHRRETVYRIIPMLVGALKAENSFYYPFNRLNTISIQYPSDSSFRIFTWTLKDQTGIYRHFGAIQMNEAQLKLFPLFDMSDTMSGRPQAVLSNKNWYGAMYYRVLEQEVDGRKYYTLFGFDQNDLWSRKKLMDVLWFTDAGEPRFGAPLFQQKKDDEVKNLNRFFIEYKKTAAVNLNFFEDMDLIIFDHTAPPGEVYEGLYFTYIPDGTYEGFRWDEAIGKWSWIEKVFHYAINENDNPPMPAPILDDRD
jgi:hypothetical protein